ncbi:spore coat protein [Bacillus sp. Marseille-Q3570]|uniref:spore coat protein n=1 Tax=Bacillus sp. Marseille-Q3570 TaxID=2963522 RepID=UPI0021B7406A|nr:spore coat protein [Bacillus sp. Marseille-Q3570]
MKIQNPEKNVPNIPEMNDRDFMNDVLGTEKYLTDSYSHAMNEASHQALYQDVSSIAKETQDCQRKLFNVMFQKGWYSFDQAQTQQLQQDYQKFSGYKNQLPNGGATMQ